jgi:hypothetical protein
MVHPSHSLCWAYPGYTHRTPPLQVPPGALHHRSVGSGREDYQRSSAVHERAAAQMAVKTAAAQNAWLTRMRRHWHAPFSEINALAPVSLITVLPEKGNIANSSPAFSRLSAVPWEQLREDAQHEVDMGPSLHEGRGCRSLLKWRGMSSPAVAPRAVIAVASAHAQPGDDTSSAVSRPKTAKSAARMR